MRARILAVVAAFCLAAAGSPAEAADPRETADAFVALFSPPGNEVSYDAAVADGGDIVITGFSLKQKTGSDTLVVPRIVLSGVEKRSPGGFTAEIATFADGLMNTREAVISWRELVLTDMIAPTFEETRANRTLQPFRTADLAGVTVSGGALPEPIRFASLAIGIDMEADGTLVDLTLSLKDLDLAVGLFRNNTVAMKAIGDLGYSGTKLNAELSVGYSPSADVLRVRKFTVEAEGIGSFGADGEFTGFSILGVTRNDGQLMAKGGVRRADLRFDDAGVTARILDAAAKASGLPRDQLIASAISSISLGQTVGAEESRRIAEAIGAFLRNPGTLVLAARPSVPVGLASFVGAPQDLARLLNLRVEAHAPGAAPAADPRREAAAVVDETPSAEAVAGALRAALADTGAMTYAAAVEGPGDRQVRIAGFRLESPSGRDSLAIGDIVFQTPRLRGDGTLTAALVTLRSGRLDGAQLAIEWNEAVILDLVLPEGRAGAGSVAPLPLDGMEAKGVRIINKRNPAPITVETARLTISTADDGTIRGVSFRIRGGALPSASFRPEVGALVRAVGYDVILGEASIILAYDEKQNRLLVSSIEATVDGAGAIEAKFQFNGLSVRDLLDGRDSLIEAATLAGGSVRFNDSGLTGKVLAYWAKQQGLGVEAAAAAVPGLIALAAPELHAAAGAAVATFLQRPGSLTASLQPPARVSLKEIDRVGSAADLIRIVGLSVSATEGVALKPPDPAPPVVKADTPPPPEPKPLVIAPDPPPKVAALPPPARIAPDEHRVALVIANGAYEAVTRLPNPPNDAALIADAFRRAGFDVVLTANDVGRDAFIRALRDFRREADRADWAVVYYAGHGMELDRINYLIPVDARLESDRDVPDEAIPLDRIESALSGARKIKLIILDACRNNPFLAEMKAGSATRSVTRGLAQVEPGSATLIAFAARAGSVAADGPDRNSPFALALASRLSVPGVEINLVFRQVRADVLAATGNNQEPFIYGSLPPDPFYFIPPP